jgi:hypothetical protein
VKIICSILYALLLVQGSITQPPLTREVYSWVSTESIPRDPSGRVNGKPAWTAHWRLKPPYDTLVYYRNNDSIRMISSDAPGGTVFRKVQIKARKWKPKPDYHNRFFLLGTYTRRDLGGLYTSFYMTKDRSSLLQVWYSNPGNMTDALLFSKGAVNILQRDGVVIDARNEQPEPEEGQIRRQ